MALVLLINPIGLVLANVSSVVKTVTCRKSVGQASARSVVARGIQPDIVRPMNVRDVVGLDMNLVSVGPKHIRRSYSRNSQELRKGQRESHSMDAPSLDGTALNTT